MHKCIIKRCKLSNQLEKPTSNPTYYNSKIVNLKTTLTSI